MAKDRLVYCRVCGEQIASSAKKCPKCGARQKKGHGFRNFVLLLIVAGLVYYAYSHGMIKTAMDKFNGGNNKTTVNSERNTKKEETPTSGKEEKATLTPTQKAAEKPAESSAEKPAESSVEKPAETVSSSMETKDQTEELTSNTESKDTSANGVSPDFKEFMDSYESFMNKYCDFMETYDESNAAALVQYMSLLAEYEKMTSKVDSYNEDNLSAEDYKYYVDVMARVQKRLIDASM